MAFYDWSKNVPTSLPTLGGTQPKRSTWTTPTQEGVQASLPSTKLPWSVAEEEDEDELRKKVAALPWNQPVEKPKTEVPKSPYVSQTKEEIQRKYGFTPASDIPTGVAYVGERAKQSGIEQLRSTIGIPQRMVSFMKSVWQKIAGDEDNALNQVLQQQERYEARGKDLSTKAVEALLPYQQRSEQRIAKAEASGAISNPLKFVGDVATVPAQQVGFLVEAATGIPVGSLSIVSSYVGKELDTGGETEDILAGGVKGVVSGQIEKRFFNLFSFLSPAGKTATGIFNKIASKVVPASVAKSPVLSVLSHVLAASGGEGIEEWVNTYTDEIVDWRIKNPDAPIGSWLNRQTLSEANYSALVGAASGALLSSTRYLRGSQRTVDDKIVSALTKDVASIPASDIESPENVQKVELLNHVLVGKAVDPQADAPQLIQEYLDQKSQPQPEAVTAVTEPVASPVEPTTSDLGADQASDTTTAQQVASQLSPEATAPSMQQEQPEPTQTEQRTGQRAPVQEKARVSIQRETVSGKDRLSAKIERSVSDVEKDLLAANGIKYDEKTDRYYTGTDLTSRKLFESAIESLDVENLDEVIDSVNEMFEEPTGGIFSSKKGAFDLGAKNDAKTGYDGIENDTVAERIEQASFFVPQQKQGKGILGDIVESWQRFTRGGIDIDRRYGDIRAAIFRLRNSRGAAATAIKMTLLKTVNKLSQDQYKLLSHAFVFRDMIEDISLGTVNMNDLPFGYGSDIDGLLKQAQSIEELLKDPKNKVVADTIKAMQDAMDVMRQRVIKGAAKVGGDLSFLNSRKEYMTHAVIEYIEEIKKTGKRTAEKFYQRYGTNKDYITDPTIAYFIAMQKLYRMDAKNNLMFQVQKHDVAKDFVIKSGDDAGTLGEIPDGYSILNKETLGIKIDKTAQKTAFEEKIKSRRSLWDSRITEAKEDLQAQIQNGATEAEQERLNKRIAQMERTRDHDDAMLKEQLGKMEHENYVLPSEIVEAIQEEYKHDVKKEMLIGRVGKAMTGLFKRNALVNPTQLVKYNIKNMFGDFEAMLATYPEGIKKIPQALNELWNGLVLNKQTKFFEEWVRAGQMDSGLMSTSLEELNNSTRVLYDKAALNNKTGAKGVASKFANAWHKYWEGASSATSFREQILRYATALAVHEEIKKDIKRGGRGLPRLFGTKLANYGASVPVEVLSTTDTFERALLLTNQAIGNYQDVSQLTRTLSKYAIPFGRWLEVNPMRWGRIIKNTMTTDPDIVMGKGEQAISTFAKGAKVGSFTVMKIGKVALSIAMFNLFLLLWNRVFFKDDDDKLPESIKEQSHITLGTFPGTDKVMYFQDLSSFGQFSEMFGLNGKIPFYSDVKRVLNGETTFENFVKESVAQAGGIWVNSFTPFAKTPIEAYLVKGSLFPDPSNPRPIYDVAEHFFAAADLKNVYRTIKGLPVKGGSYLTELSSSLVNSVEAGDAATWDMYSIREDYLKSIGEYKKPTRYEKDAKALAIYYFKQALRYGDNEAAVEYLAKYVQAGGTKKTYNASMNSLDPLFGLKKEQKTGILEWMNEDQKETYERAVQNFEELKELGKEYWN